MDWSKIGSTLAQVGLPLLGAALPIPGGAAIGAALAAAIGADKPTPEGVLDALTQSADARQKALEFQLVHQAELMRMTMEHERALVGAEVEDRKSARERDMAWVQAGRHNWRSDVLAVLAVGGLVTCVYFIAEDTGMPERAVNAIMFVAGVLASAVRDVYGFEFGSSRGSRDKDELIARAPAVK